MAEYDHPHFGRWAAITTAAHNNGRITCVGTIPNASMAKGLFHWLSASMPVPIWRDRPDSVTVTTGLGHTGERIHFVHNWSWTPAALRVPMQLRDVLQDQVLAEGSMLDLGPWDVRVLSETTQS